MDDGSNLAWRDWEKAFQLGTVQSDFVEGLLEEKDYIIQQLAKKVETLEKKLEEQ